MRHRRGPDRPEVVGTPQAGRASSTPGRLERVVGFLQLTEAQRAWAYRVILAAGTLALVAGWATDSEVTAWVGLAGALLGNGLAAGHTSTRRRG